ncbi:MAG: hypothetical protein K2J04_12045, partial [Lachnospiraceae bacterium]|nr:hypothetical protein [Lachnospiraceae bacterium]
MKKILTWICIINLLWITGCSGKDTEASFTQNEEEAVVDNAEPEEADDRESDVEVLDAGEREVKSE